MKMYDCVSSLAKTQSRTKKHIFFSPPSLWTMNSMNRKVFPPVLPHDDSSSQHLKMLVIISRLALKSTLKTQQEEHIFT